MKKHLFLNSLALILFCHVYGIGSTNKINVQQKDTIGYLHDNFIMHKSKFQNKELNVILNELHLVVRSYTFAFPSKPGGPSKSITLFFEDSKIISNKLHSGMPVPILVIYFQNEISKSDIWKLYYKSQGAWTQDEKDFFGKQIVKDIRGVKGAKD